MSRLTVRLPNALHIQLDKLARAEGVSLNQYIVYALTRQATIDIHSLQNNTAKPAKANGPAKQAAAVQAEDEEDAGVGVTDLDDEAEARLRRRFDDFPPPENK